MVRNPFDDEHDPEDEVDVHGVGTDGPDDVDIAFRSIREECERLAQDGDENAPVTIMDHLGVLRSYIDQLNGWIESRDEEVEHLRGILRELVMGGRGRGTGGEESDDE